MYKRLYEKEEYKIVMENNEILQSFIELQPGTTLNNGKYVIEKKIGVGGFGITYKAMQIGLDRIVCIYIRFHTSLNR